MQNEIIENENNKVVYEPPSFEEAGSFRDATGTLVMGWSDGSLPGFL